MNFVYLMALVITLGVFIYLIAALLKGEKLL